MCNLLSSIYALSRDLWKPSPYPYCHIFADVQPLAKLVDNYWGMIERIRPCDGVHSWGRFAFFVLRIWRVGHFVLCNRIVDVAGRNQWQNTIGSAINLCRGQLYKVPNGESRTLIVGMMKHWLISICLIKSLNNSASRSPTLTRIRWG